MGESTCTLRYTHSQLWFGVEQETTHLEVALAYSRRLVRLGVERETIHLEEEGHSREQSGAEGHSRERSGVERETTHVEVGSHHETCQGHPTTAERCRRSPTRRLTPSFIRG